MCLGLSKSIWTGSGSIGCVILTHGLGLSMNLSVLSNMLFLLTAATLYSDSASSRGFVFSSVIQVASRCKAKI